MVQRRQREPGVCWPLSAPLADRPGFYDLRVRQTIEQQTSLARRYGIAGFCVYYYNFGHRRALDRAFEAIVADQSIDFPYCICWANENWTRHWDGGSRELIFEQKYDPEMLQTIIDDATRYAADPRYLRVNGKPLFLVYRPLLIPDIRGFTALCRQGFRQAGFDDVHLVYIESMDAIQKLPPPNDLGFDACVEFPPQGLAVPATDPPIPIRADFAGACYDYKSTALGMVSRASVAYKRYPRCSRAGTTRPDSRCAATVLFGPVQRRSRPTLRKS